MRYLYFLLSSLLFSPLLSAQYFCYPDYLTNTNTPVYYPNYSSNNCNTPSIYGKINFENSLMNLSAGDPMFSLKDDASFQSYGIQLTSRAYNKKGGLFIHDTNFITAAGLVVEFEYVMDQDGGSAGYGDGMSFFLYDGSLNDNEVSLGAYGGGLGYYYNARGNSVKGLTKAYIGVGLDQFGNFQLAKDNGTETVNGIRTSRIGSQLTIRGAGNDFTGYPVLVSKSTNYLSNIGKSLDVNTGSYVDAFYTGDRFQIRGANSYRKALLKLVPHYNTGTTTRNGFDIDVDVSINPYDPNISIIDNFHYPESLRYNQSASGTNIQTLEAEIPSSLKLGFAASTGDAIQRHYIKNLKVYLPFIAEANNNVAETCTSTPVTIAVLDNDLAYTGLVSASPEPTPDKDNIDLNQFSFERENSEDLTLYHYKTTPLGNWSYNKNNGLVTFIPSSSFGVDNTPATISYTIKGKSVYENGVLKEPYGDEAYRSFPATITVNVQRTDCTVINESVISNKMVTQEIIE